MAAAQYALLAAEADPASTEALRALLAYPLPEFLELGLLDWLDALAPGLAGVPAAHRLDAWVFATDAPAIAQTWVRGRRVR